MRNIVYDQKRAMDAGVKSRPHEVISSYCDEILYWRNDCDGKVTASVKGLKEELPPFIKADE